MNTTWAKDLTGYVEASELKLGIEDAKRKKHVLEKYIEIMENYKFDEHTNEHGLDGRTNFEFISIDYDNIRDHYVILLEKRMICTSHKKFEILWEED